MLYVLELHAVLSAAVDGPCPQGETDILIDITGWDIGEKTNM